jgi:small conductance mechanosensitive channel
MLQELEAVLVSVLLIIVLMTVGLIAVRILAKRIPRLLKNSDHIPATRRQQLLTLAQVVRWGADVLIVGIGLMMLLSTVGINIVPLLTSVGVAGLAVSLGAQTLIKDLIGGLLILAENQYIVGDSIQVGDVSGVVERLTLRVTQVRDVRGHLHIIPNGDVRTVGNMTRDWSRALVDVGVAYEEDIERALRVLEAAAAAFAANPTVEPDLLEPPQVLGPLSLGDWAFTVRVMVKTKAGKQWQVARELQKWILQACEREGVSLPYPRQEVWVRSADAS